MINRKNIGIVLTLTACCLAFHFEAAAQDIVRPPITGLSHVAFFVRDVDSSRIFYKQLLGYEEPYQLNKADGSLDLTFIKINDRQWIELFTEREAGANRLYQIAFATTDAEQLRLYLASRGVKVPEKVSRGRIGNLNFTVRDPDGHIVEFVQTLPDGWTKRDEGKHLSAERLSDHLKHVGFTVDLLERSLAFYRDILGCTETWRGSSTGEYLSWVNLKVPDGDDYVELMLFNDPPSAERLGSMNHLSLEVADCDSAASALQTRATHVRYDRPIAVRTGINRKRQLNMFDPDGTRTEFMEPAPRDGVAAPSSKARPPR